MEYVEIYKFLKANINKMFSTVLHVMKSLIRNHTKVQGTIKAIRDLLSCYWKEMEQNVMRNLISNISSLLQFLQRNFTLLTMLIISLNVFMSSLFTDLKV